MASAPKESRSKPEYFDMIKRGIQRSNPAGTLTFVGLRAVEPLFQYGVLAHGIGTGILNKLGLQTLPAMPPNTGTFLDKLGLSPYRLILFSMSSGAALKQIYWMLGIAQEEMTPASAVSISIFNLVWNSVNTLLFTCVSTSASLSSGSKFPQTPLLIGSALYAIGISVELASEYQRKLFKQDARNIGKVCTTGLWSLSRHINYAGYTLWRTGFALASGGYVWGAITAGFFAGDFLSRAVPALDSYCAERVSYNSKQRYIVLMLINTVRRTMGCICEEDPIWIVPIHHLNVCSNCYHYSSNTGCNAHFCLLAKTYSTSSVKQQSKNKKYTLSVLHLCYYST
jgi:protein-S-isoprenylcysteine O-methyltransferase Ste14